MLFFLSCLASFEFEIGDLMNEEKADFQNIFYINNNNNHNNKIWNEMNKKKKVEEKREKK